MKLSSLFFYFCFLRNCLCFGFRSFSNKNKSFLVPTAHHHLIRHGPLELGRVIVLNHNIRYTYVTSIIYHAHIRRYYVQIYNDTLSDFNSQVYTNVLALTN